MKYERFEDLPVWQASADLAAKIFAWTEDGKFRGRGDPSNQLQRAVLSISNNIAEGFERGSTNELINFLYYARGSAGEVRSMLCVIERIDGYHQQAIEISNLKSICESVSRQIRAWTGSLQNSDIKGQRHLNDNSKKRYLQGRQRTNFQQQLKQQVRQNLIDSGAIQPDMEDED